MKISIKAIFSGYGVWILCVVIFAFLNTFIFKLIEGKYGSEYFYQYFNYFITIINFSLDLIAGYVAAKIAIEDELKHGLIIGLIIFSTSLIITFLTSRSVDSYLNKEFAIPLFLSIVGCLTGAYIQKRIKEKRKIEAPIETKIDELGKE